MRWISIVGPRCPPCGPLAGLAGPGRENNSAQANCRPCWAFVGRVWKVAGFMGLGAVSARSEKKLSTGSKVKREKMQGLLLHPCMVHRARQCRSLREFSDFREKKQKGVAKFVFREKWGCKPDKRRYSAKYSGVAPPEGSAAGFRYQRTNINSRYGSTRTRWQRLRSCTGRMIAAVNLSSSKRQFGFILAVLLPRMAHLIFQTLSSPT